MLIDITPTLSCGTPVYPGDAAFRVAWAVPRAETRTGGACVSTASLSPHAGAHVDAPMHLCFEGADAAAMPLELFLGAAAVIDVREALHGRRLVSSAMLQEDDWRRLAGVPRALIRTRDEHPSSWTNAFAGLSPELVDRLAGVGVKLIGIDTPSIDPMPEGGESDPLAAHHRALAHGAAVLENLLLADAPAGIYELIALPVKWAGAEAAPVRAVLRTLEGSDTHAKS